MTNAMKKLTNAEPIKAICDAAPKPAVPSDEQIHSAHREALGQSIRERDMSEIRKFARALLGEKP